MKARGMDERTWYGFGSTHYIISLLMDVFRLNWDNQEVDMIHRYHNEEKLPMLKNTFGVKDLHYMHILSLQNGEKLIEPILENFEEGVKQVKNSYW